MKRDFPAASIVGDCIVFNIGGNKYRLVTRIRFRLHRVYVLKVMTHAEYDRLPRIQECGCHDAPPIHAKATQKKKRKN
jgi:mRNA interferase HigB